MAKQDKTKKLTPKQKQAVDLLINSSMNYKQICETIGINPSQLYRWRTQPEFAGFQAEYQRVKDEQWAATVEAARASALKLCQEGNQKMTEFILKNDGLNPTHKVDAEVKGEQTIIITIQGDDEEDE